MYPGGFKPQIIIRLPYVAQLYSAHVQVQLAASLTNSCNLLFWNELQLFGEVFAVIDGKLKKMYTFDSLVICTI